MNAAMINMVVKGEQEEIIRRTGKDWANKSEPDSYRSGEMRRVVYGLAFSSVMGLLILLVAWLIMAI